MPAWWIFPNANIYGIWPRSGEIDILEHLGRPEEVMNGYGSIQRDNGSGNGGNVSSSYVATGADWTLDWHTWALLWERSTDNRVILRYFVDGVPYGIFDQSMWAAAPGGQAGSPFDQPFHAILNLAVGIKPGGPGWAGTPDPAISGRYMEVDWVRVWQRN
jgi:beta-glucanase (GH16 family)